MKKYHDNKDSTTVMLEEKSVIVLMKKKCKLQKGKKIKHVFSIYYYHTVTNYCTN